MTPQTRILGSTGFNASMLRIGDLADRAVPMERCVATIHRAMDFGLNLIDTAPGYEDGYSEAIVGAALQGRREGMFVIDKIDDLDKPAGPQVDGSLKALGLGMVDLFVFHAGTTLQDGNCVTNGGRVLGVTALGSTVQEAIDRAYAGIDVITWPGVHYRRDIGKKALDR